MHLRGMPVRSILKIKFLKVSKSLLMFRYRILKSLNINAMQLYEQR